MQECLDCFLSYIIASRNVRIWCGIRDFTVFWQYDFCEILLVHFVISILSLRLFHMWNGETWCEFERTEKFWNTMGNETNFEDMPKNVSEKCFIDGVANWNTWLGYICQNNPDFEINKTFWKLDQITFWVCLLSKW